MENVTVWAKNIGECYYMNKDHKKVLPLRPMIFVHKQTIGFNNPVH